jgi:ATP-binding cassette, subfamily B, bacterial PglK
MMLKMQGLENLYKLYRRVGLYPTSMGIVLALIASFVDVAGIMLFAPYIESALKGSISINLSGWIGDITLSFIEMTLLFVLFYLARLIVVLVNQYFVYTYFMNINRRLNDLVMINSILKRVDNESGFHSAKHARLISFDVGATLNGVFVSIYQIIFDMITAIMIMAYLAYVNIIIFIGMVVIGGVLALVVMRPVFINVNQIGHKKTKSERKKLSVFTDMIHSLKFIRASGSFDYFRMSFMTYVDNAAQYWRHYQVIAQIPRLSIDFALVLTIVASGFWLVSANGIEVYDPEKLPMTLGVFVFSIIRLAPLAGRITTVFNNLVFSMPSVDLLYDVVGDDDVECNIRNIEQGDNSKCSIVGRDLRYSINNKKLFSGLNFEWEAGDFIVIKGESGCGKSTLLSIILSEVEPEGGEVVISYGSQSKSIRHAIGYVEQDVFFSNDSLKNNLTLSSDSIPDSIKLKYLWELFRIQDFLGDIGGALNSIVSEGGKNFSGGQKQRLALVRAFYLSHGIVLLDEATSGLDKENQDIVTKALIELQREYLIVLVTHADSTDEYSTDIIRL